jgi:hypothetical protein
MGLWTLVGLLAAAMALRIAFVVLFSRDADSLWYDYEHRGSRFQLARLLDYATLAGFLGAVVWTLWKSDEHDSSRLAKFFVAWLGWSLLARLQVHRFPRMNRPGLYDQAMINFYAHLLMSLLSTVAVTAALGVYFWWRG